MANLYSVFLRYEKNDSGDSHYYDGYYRSPPIVEDYIGSFITRSAAEAVANGLKMEDYSIATPDWNEDIWTNFAFVYEHRLNLPVDVDVVSKEADRITDNRYDMWKVSPAGLAHSASVEKSRRDAAAKKTAKIEAEKARVREMSRVARAARTAKKKAASTHAT